MKNNFKAAFIFSLILLLSFPALNALFAQEKDFKALLGNWDVELLDMGMAMEFVFKMDGDALSGEMNFEMGNGIMEEIVFTDNELTFFVSLDAGGQIINVEAVATVDGENMTGMMFTDMGEVEFSGTKRKDI